MRLAARTNRTCDYSLHVAANETDTACRYSNRCWWCCHCYVLFMISLGVIVTSAPEPTMTVPQSRTIPHGQVSAYGCLAHGIPLAFSRLQW